MTTDTTALPITIVSTDRAALRELSWTLRALGFESISSNDWSKTAMWRLLDQPSLLLLDARDREEIQGFLDAPRSKPYRYVIAFHDALAGVEAAKLIELGTEDIISFPGKPGEMLTRMQAGLRRVEFERRLAETISWDTRSGLTTGNGFARQLQGKIDDRARKADSVVIALRIDLQEILSTQFGSLVSEMANNTLARCLAEQTTDEDFFAVLNDGVFLAYLENSAVREGVQFAELIVKEFKAQNVLAPEFGARVTVSGTVLSLPSNESAGEVVHRAQRALDQVVDSGGNLILDAFALEESFSMWQRRLNGSNPSRGTMAKHIMEPLPFVLPAEGKGAAMFGSLGLLPEAPHPPCTVAVDRQGHFLGVLDQSSYEEVCKDSSASLEECLVHTATTVDCNQPLPGVSELMDAADGDYLIVLDGEKPVGYVTREKLSTTDSFHVTEPDGVPEYDATWQVESLVVPAG